MRCTAFTVHGRSRTFSFDLVWFQRSVAAYFNHAVATGDWDSGNWDPWSPCQALFARVRTYHASAIDIIPSTLRCEQVRGQAARHTSIDFQSPTPFAVNVTFPVIEYVINRNSHAGVPLAVDGQAGPGQVANAAPLAAVPAGGPGWPDQPLRVRSEPPTSTLRGGPGPSAAGTVT
jgi:hypothetical protein